MLREFDCEAIEQCQIQNAALIGGTPIFGPNFFSMTPVFDSFAHRPFPLFD